MSGLSVPLVFPTSAGIAANNEMNEPKKMALQYNNLHSMREVSLRARRDCEEMKGLTYLRKGSRSDLT